jgi:hypothetical protein
MTLITLVLAYVLACPASQLVLEGAADRVAQAWTTKDASVLGKLMAKEGIQLHLPEEEHLLIRPRQAQAALQVFLGRYLEGEAQVTRVSQAGVGAEKGFAEIRWRTGSPGLTDPVIFTLFIGFAQVDEGWVVTEIRVLF